MVGEELEADRALPGDDVLVVERVHERAVLALDELLTERHRLGHALAVQLDARAERLRAADLHVRSGLRHHDRGVDAEQPRVTGDGLRVVAGAHRDDAARRARPRSG